MGETATEQITINVCFRLPTIPKFRSPAPIFLSFLGFFTFDSSQKNVFTFKSIFVATYTKTNSTRPMKVNMKLLVKHFQKVGEGFFHFSFFFILKEVAMSVHVMQKC